MRHHWLRILLLFSVAGGAIAASFFLADYVHDNGTAQKLVEDFGYLGILTISIVSGLNLFVPVPAATFTPIFTTAGFPMLGIIAVLVVGTIIADSIGYLIGMAGRHAAELHYPAVQKRLVRFARRHHSLIVPGVFLYASFAPFPNEVILVPLALIGTRFRELLAPLIAGTIVYQVLFSYGAQGIFDALF